MPRQLYSLTTENFEAFSWLNREGTAETVRVSDMPLVIWPNGRWCLEVNLFLAGLFEKGYSTRGDGGTLSVYTAYLTPLIRYCFDSNREFINLSDADFTLCIKSLSVETVVRAGELVQRRNPTTVCSMGSVWLEFLEFLGDYYAYCDFVSKSGRIRGYKEYRRHLLPSGQWVVRKVWCHLSFPEKEPLNRRLPMTDPVLQQLIKAADIKYVHNNFLRMRTLAMLEIFEEIGFRRMEAVFLRLKDVREALTNREAAREENQHDFVACLKFRTVKSKNKTFGERSVPISDTALDFLRDYGIIRKMHLKKLGLANNPERAFFISCKTGRSLRANTITQEFSALATIAGVATEGASPHTMRHRYITKAFIRLILSHNIENEDEFQKALLDTTAFKKKVAEITGHASDESLDNYIHLAFEQIAGLKLTMSRAAIEQEFDALDRANDRYRAAILRGENVAETGNSLSEAVDSIKRRVKASRPTLST